MRLAALVLVAACSSSTRYHGAVPGVVPIAVVSWPRPKCALPAMPDPPEFQPYLDPAGLAPPPTRANPTASGIERYYVTVRNVEDVVEYYKKISRWARMFRACADKVADVCDPDAEDDFGNKDETCK